MTTPRSDAANLKILETLRPTYEKLRAERIRNDADIERHARDHEEAKAKAEEVLGTADEAEIKARIEAIRAQNTDRVDTFDAALKDVQQRLEALEQGPAA